MLAGLVPQGAKCPKDVGNVLWLALVSLSAKGGSLKNSTTDWKQLASVNEKG